MILNNAINTHVRKTIHVQWCPVNIKVVTKHMYNQTNTYTTKLILCTCVMIQ